MFVSVVANAIFKSRKELVDLFLKRGYKVIVAAPDNSVDIKTYFDNNPKITYETWSMSRTGVNFINDFKSIKDLRSIIRKHNPDLLYSFGGAKAAIYATIAGSKENIHKNYCMVNGLGSIIHGKGLKNYILKMIMMILFRYSMKKSDKVLFQNKDDLNYFLSKKIVTTSKTKIINGSGVNLKLFPYTKPINLNVFLFVGRLLKDKGIYEFVEAAKLIKDKYPLVEFWVIGGLDDNPTSVSQDDINKWVKNDLITYFGELESVKEYYQKCSVFVLPSFHEGTPRTSLEAMAIGRPIITTNTVGCKETVVDGTNGYLVPVKSVDLIARKMEFFIQNPDKVTSMGYESYKLALRKYDVKLINKSILEAFNIL